MNKVEEQRRQQRQHMLLLGSYVLEMLAEEGDTEAELLKDQLNGFIEKRYPQ